MFNQEAIGNPEQTLVNVECEPKYRGTKEISTWHNKSRDIVALILTSKNSYRRDQTRASDEQDNTLGDSVTREDERRRWCPHLAIGRRFPHQHALGQEEEKVQAPPGQER